LVSVDHCRQTPTQPAAVTLRVQAKLSADSGCRTSSMFAEATMRAGSSDV
jgi:hypothetical protein